MAATGLCAAFGSMQLSARPRPALSFKSAMAGQQLVAGEGGNVVAVGQLARTHGRQPRPQCALPPRRA